MLHDYCNKRFLEIKNPHFSSHLLCLLGCDTLSKEMEFALGLLFVGFMIPILMERNVELSWELTFAVSD